MAPKRNVARSGKMEQSCCGSGCCAGAGCCGLPEAGCCQVEAVVRVDARGQMVLPKVVRQQLSIAPGSKLAVIVWRKGGTPCCLALMKADELADSVRQAVGPLLGEISRGRAR